MKGSVEMFAAARTYVSEMDRIQMRIEGDVELTCGTAYDVVDSKACRSSLSDVSKIRFCLRYEGT